jgi:hypothetical protein
MMRGPATRVELMQGTPGHADSADAHAWSGPGHQIAKHT